jgi:TRAP-type C4-dicarboxylate transport system permease small subunit
MFRVIYRWSIKIAEIISIVGVSLIVLFTAYEVIIRNVFNKPTIWTNEITSYLLVWLGMLGIVYAYDKGTHVSVDFVFRRLNTSTQRFLNALTVLLILTFSILICMYGYKYWWLAYSKGWRHFGMLDVPMSYTRISLPIVGILLVFQTSIATYDSICNFFLAVRKKKIQENNIL